jgi:4a-hydroxytetrahydrobiopterin dehydratase
MSRPTKLDTGIEGWLQEHPGWQREGATAIVRTFEFKEFRQSVGFVVQLAMLAEKHDHHPDIDVRFNKVRVLWSTHDAGGLTRLDLLLAEAADELVG